MVNRQQQMRFVGSRGIGGICLAVAALFMLGIAGCGSSGGGGSSTVANKAIPTGSGGVAVDPLTKLAFVAMDRNTISSGAGIGDGAVSVINVGVNPNKKNPDVTMIDLGHPDYPTGVAVNPNKGRVYVASGNNGNGGFLDIISETKKKLLTAGAPIPFPAGSDTGPLGQVVFNPKNNTLVVSTTDGPGCSSPGTCTGFAVYNIASKTFGPIIQATPGTTDTNGADAFALNFNSGVIVGPDDDLDNFSTSNPTQLVATNVPAQSSCTLGDTNIGNMFDAEGSSIDPTTNIVVVGGGAPGPTPAVVVNLNGSSFSGTKSPCTLNEGGTPPNSVTESLGGTVEVPGVAVNAVTHQAFMTGISNVGLISLPKNAVAQIDSSMVTTVTSTLPDTPDGNSFDAQVFPYYTTVDAKHNMGYVVGRQSGSFLWLAQVNLSKFQSNPSGISTALPSGTCAGTSTTLGCDNGNGVRYYPIPTP